MDFWSWIVQVQPQNVIAALSGTTVITFFLTDQLLTKGQHVRRVDDLVAHHTAEIAEKDARIQEYKEARDYYRAAHETERTRADGYAIKFSEVSMELAQLSDHLASTFKEVAEDPS